VTTLVLGPSAGTSADACWGPTAALLRDDFDVLAWELPGHGFPGGPDSGPIPDDLTIEELAARVLAQVDGPFLYAGDSVGGQVGLQLLLDAPERVLGAVLCCTGARIGDATVWHDRVAQIRASGTASIVDASAQRWFAPGFLEREPERASALLHALRDTSDDGYVAVCGALAAYDVRGRLGEIAAPVVAVAGAHDPVCPPDLLREIADGVQHGRLVVLDDVGHQAPAEAPEEVAMIIRGLAKELAAGEVA
jgi:3-oxoadipate enol-lactonase / 4-carboxymuconolactone decarboxylase